MRELLVKDFELFFRELWGFEPFPWQSDLAKRVIAGKDKPWPDAIAVPTAAGKTACIDIAVFNLAASLGNDRPSPRRIWFVVDRRVIVDEAYERARALADRLEKADKGIVFEVARRLRLIADGNRPLSTHLLRGGVYRDDAWSRNPLQPAVIASTVDQFGSRLLFRAYGRSSKAWPIQAGLAGNDSLVLLDEAHCARPFHETVSAVAGYRKIAKEHLPAPFHTVVLSATPPGEIQDRHELGILDRVHPVLGARLRAGKPTRLLPPVGSKGKAVYKDIAEAMACEARNLINPAAGRLAVVVFCNRVATARQVYTLLCAYQDHDTVLLTGRMRPIDKDETVNIWLDRLSATTSGTRRLERPVVIVSTQTLEVGANLDFDGMVSECASLDSLRQRMGRLNRTGRNVDARAILLIRDEQARSSDDDPVYGPALARTWQWLKDLADGSDEVDFGVEALGSHLPQSGALDELNTPSRHAPVLLPAHVDALAQTAPAPFPSPDPALFLHGPERGVPDIQVCWRADLDPDRPEQWAEVMVLCPPAAAECLAVSFGKMRAWLDGVGEVEELGDLEGIPEPRREQTTGKPRSALRWLGRDEAESISGSIRLRPGDVIVLSGLNGGLEDLGHHPPGAPVDRGDRAYLEARGKAILRLHPKVMAEWTDGLVRERLLSLAEDSMRREEEPEAWVNELRSALAELANHNVATQWSWLPRVAEELSGERNLARCVVEHPGGGVMIRGSRCLRTDADGGFTDEDDATASGTVRVELLDHMKRVGVRARRHGGSLNLSREIIEALTAAGDGHDLGKADLRFQAWLHGGRPPVGPLLAKSGDLQQHPRANRKARERAGYPEGGRHEFLSVRLAEASGLGVVAERDLLLHLIESHHGHARPFAPVVIDPCPISVHHPRMHEVVADSATGLERLGSGTAERYWRLTRRYGWWGLAYLEALLRLADHIESAEEQG